MEIVELNVGGTHYTTTRSTLLSSPYGQGSINFFHGLLEGNVPAVKDKSGAFFIDRNGKTFGVILEYLRSGVIELVPGVSRESVNREAEFYMLPFVTRGGKPKIFVLKDEQQREFRVRLDGIYVMNNTVLRFMKRNDELEAYTLLIPGGSLEHIQYRLPHAQAKVCIDTNGHSELVDQSHKPRLMPLSFDETGVSCLRCVIYSRPSGKVSSLYLTNDPNRVFRYRHERKTLSPLIYTDSNLLTFIADEEIGSECLAFLLSEIKTLQDLPGGPGRVLGFGPFIF